MLVGPWYGYKIFFRGSCAQLFIQTALLCFYLYFTKYTFAARARLEVGVKQVFLSFLRVALIDLNDLFSSVTADKQL
jgi:hypothetical protein